MPASTIEKARRFRALHQGRVLLLPNVWDPLGARLLEHLGYPAVATASAAVAFSLGYDDGERLTFDAMLDAVRRVAGAVDVPVTADIERGYAQEPVALADNIARVIEAGAVGINLEDSLVEGGSLRDVGGQCRRIAAVRARSDALSAELFINARIDVYLCDASSSDQERLDQTITRARAYLDAGADGIYPITVGDVATLARIREAITAPINVYGGAATAPLSELERVGIARVSFGPGLMKRSLTAMRDALIGLRDDGSFEPFRHDVIESAEIRHIVRDGRMG